MRGFFLTALLLLICCGCARAEPQADGQAPAAAAVAKPDFSNWAAVVVAGDWRSHAGGDTEAFDNTRRDVSQALVKAGFDPANIRQYSLRPPRPGDDPAIYVSPHAVVMGFIDVADKAPAGCLFYISSHGSPDGAVFGPTAILDPAKLKLMLDQICGKRPTVAIVSACFSGVFVPAIAAPNRLVMTAAREDRSSFGCSDKDRYPYFDACILQSLPTSPDFLVLSKKATACVHKRETDEQLEPSEPQTSVGGAAKLWLPFTRFANRVPGSG
jgi:hypothetical protein